MPAFAAGFSLLIALIRTTRRLQHASPTVRRAVTAAETVLLASLLGGILVIGNLLAFRFGGRPIDFTRERAFSLSSAHDEYAPLTRSPGPIRRDRL